MATDMLKHEIGKYRTEEPPEERQPYKRAAKWAGKYIALPFGILSLGAGIALADDFGNPKSQSLEQLTSKHKATDSLMRVAQNTAKQGRINVYIEKLVVDELSKQKCAESDVLLMELETALRQNGINVIKYAQDAPENTIYIQASLRFKDCDYDFQRADTGAILDTETINVQFVNKDGSFNDPILYKEDSRQCPDPMLKNVGKKIADYLKMKSFKRMSQIEGKNPNEVMIEIGGKGKYITVDKSKLKQVTGFEKEFWEGLKNQEKKDYYLKQLEKLNIGLSVDGVPYQIN